MFVARCAHRAVLPRGPSSRPALPGEEVAVHGLLDPYGGAATVASRRNRASLAGLAVLLVSPIAVKGQPFEKSNVKEVATRLGPALPGDLVITDFGRVPLLAHYHPSDSATPRPPEQCPTRDPPTSATRPNGWMKAVPR